MDFPLLQPQALWKQSGRRDASVRATEIMATVTNHAGWAHVLGSTHEQIGRRFCEELLRTRELAMKDASSSHIRPAAEKRLPSAASTALPPG